MKAFIWPQLAAEAIGTFFLVFFGCGSVILFQTDSGAMLPAMIPVVFGGTVAMMIYATGHISGAHFNPAVTIAFAALGRFPWRRVPGYAGAQIAAAIVASLSHSLIWVDGHNFGTTGISTTLVNGLFVEFILSFVLMFVITSVATDARAVGEAAGIAIGLAVTLCAFVGGPLTGASMNPARTLGPALVSGNLVYLWVYLTVPVLGTVCGALAYDRIRCYNEEPTKAGCC